LALEILIVPDAEDFFEDDDAGDDGAVAAEADDVVVVFADGIVADGSDGLTTPESPKSVDD
jgi:hypothetical protein